MKAIKAKARGLTIGSIVTACDNGGAKIVKIVAIKGGKTVKGRNPSCGVADHIKISVRKGGANMKGKVFDAVIVRQRKEFKRRTGERIKFTDNAVVLMKDAKGNPKGTVIKGPIAREASDRWSNLSKMASTIV